MMEAGDKLRQLLFDGLAIEAAKEAGPEPAPVPKAKPKPSRQLPIWDDDKRASPNLIARSALFSAVSDKSKRPMLREKTLAAWGDCELQYSGPLLTQYDADVWYELVHLHKLQSAPIGGRVQFTSHSILRSMRRSCSGQSYSTLADSINRLHVCGFGMRVGGTVLASDNRMVKRYGRDETTGRWSVELDPVALELFDRGYTQFDWKQRQALCTSTAKYMQIYVSSHLATKKRPHRIGLEKLKGLCGQQCDAKQFRRQIRKAMGELSDVGLVSAWQITPNTALEFSSVARKAQCEVRPPKG